MAAKGAALKEDIVQKILSTFEGAFICNGGKEIRIEGQENGETLQIKVALTCAKVNVENPNASTPVVPRKEVSVVPKSGGSSANIGSATSSINEPTDDEKEKLANLLERLGIEV